jgi:Transposase DDE domain group 1
VRLLHTLARTRAVFDDPNLLPNAGLAPLLADSIDDMDLLRDGAVEAVFGGVRAPSTLGSFLRSFTWGNVRQLDKAHRALTAALARDPRLLPGREELTFIDIDSTQERVYGYQKEGAAFGHAKVQGKSLLLKGLSPLISAISTPLCAPVLGPVRLRGGSAGSARGAAGLAAEAIGTAREACCTGKILVRFDSAFCNSAVIRTVIRHGAHFSVTVPANSSVRAAIAAIPKTPGRPSGTRRPSGTTSSTAGYPTPRSPRPGTRRSPPSRKANRSPPGSSSAASAPATRSKHRGRTSCSPPTATTPPSPTPRSKHSRQKASTATTPSWNRSSPT